MPIDKYYNIPVTFNRAEKIKLFDIAKNATANSSDTALLARTNHTGTQAISTVTGLQTDLDAKALKTTTINGHALSSNVTVTKSDVSLSNADNTSDASKPVSTATQAALDGKVATTVTVNGHALSANVTVTKGDVGLGNCDNTSDTDKPVSDDAQAALDLKQDLITEGAHIVPATDNLSTVLLVDVLNAYNDLASKFNTLLLRLEAQDLLSDV